MTAPTALGLVIDELRRDITVAQAADHAAVTVLPSTLAAVLDELDRVNARLAEVDGYSIRREWAAE